MRGMDIRDMDKFTRISLPLEISLEDHIDPHQNDIHLLNHTGVDEENVASRREINDYENGNNHVALFDILGLPPADTNLRDLTNINLCLFGRTFEYFTGSMLLQTYGNKLVEGDVIKHRFGVSPDFFVINDLPGGGYDLEELIEVKSGRKTNSSSNREQRDRFLKLGKPLTYITYTEARNNPRIKGSDQTSFFNVSEVGSSPLFTDTEVYSLMTDKKLYKTFTESFDISKHKIEKQLLKGITGVFKNYKRHNMYGEDYSIDDMKSSYDSVLANIRRTNS